MKKCKLSGKYYINRIGNTFLYIKVLYKVQRRHNYYDQYYVFRYSLSPVGLGLCALHTFAIINSDSVEITKKEFIDTFYKSLSESEIKDKELLMKHFQNEEM